MKELTCIVYPNGCRLKVEEADGGFRVFRSGGNQSDAAALQRG